MWSGPHDQSWRGAGRAWYQSSVVLLFHARLESTSLWTRLREWRHCRAETGKEIPQTFGTKLKAKYRYDELCFDWTSCAKMTGWYLQFNHSGGFLPASLICTSAVFLFFVFFCVGIMEEFPHILGKSWNEEVVQKWGLIVGTFCLVMLLQIWCSKSKTLMNCWKTQRRDRWVLPGYLQVCVSVGIRTDKWVSPLLLKARPLSSGSAFKLSSFFYVFNTLVFSFGHIPRLCSSCQDLTEATHSQPQGVGTHTFHSCISAVLPYSYNFLKWASVLSVSR